MTSPETRRVPEGEFKKEVELGFNDNAILLNDELIICARKWKSRAGKGRKGLRFALISDAKFSVQHKRGDIRNIFVSSVEKFRLITEKLETFGNALINSCSIPIVRVGSESIVISINANIPLQIEEISGDSDFKVLLEERAAMQGK